MGWEGTLRIMLLRFKLSMSALENEPAVGDVKDGVACAMGGIKDRVACAMGVIEDGVACALESKSFTKHMLRM